MIQTRNLEIAIVGGLSRNLGCQVVRANQDAQAPPHPYVSYTITTLMVARGGTYGIYDDGTNQKQVEQIWSFTVQSKDDMESKELAFKAHNFFDNVGRSELKDKGVVTQSLSNITNRDNLLTVGYEYRNGFDATYSLMDIVADDEEAGQIIEAPIKEVIEV